MSGYVPPHLRGSSGGSEPPRAGSGGYSNGGGGGRGGYGERERSSSGGYGASDTQRGGGGGGGGSRDYGGAFGARRDESGGGRSASFAAPPTSATTAASPRGPPTPPAPPAAWAPPPHVTCLTAEQVDDIRRRLDVIVDVQPGEAAAPCPLESFDDMGLDKSIMLDVKYHGYERPTPIQCAAMPLALSGRDILGCAETGSGKTAAFAIPLIHFCLRQPAVRRGDGPLALVMAPTRELAQQIEKEVKAFSRSSKGFKTAIVVGGAPMGDQRADLRAGVDVVVATPGRFIDHLQSGNTSLGRVGFVVLDEADRMLDMGFEPQIREVMHSLPPGHQTLLFSATMPAEVEALAADYLSKPVKVKVGAVSTPTANVAQHIEKVSDAAKLDRLCELMLEEKAEAAKLGRPVPMTVIFVERKARADDVADLLSQEGVAAVALHGGRSQGEREAALRDFSTGKVPVLVATDVASRGLDVKGIAHVVNMDMPKAFEDYVHRIGRTGRAGATGRATSFYTDKDAYVVATIKTALQEAEKGNAMAFATGKEARRREREHAEAWRATGGDPGPGAVSATLGVLRVDDKLKHQARDSTRAVGMMATSAERAASAKPGAPPPPNADAAWDD